MGAFVAKKVMKALAKAVVKIKPKKSVKKPKSKKPMARKKTKKKFDAKKDPVLKGVRSQTAQNIKHTRGAKSMSKKNKKLLKK